MATSTCGKCGGTDFESRVVETKNTRYKVNFFQCAACGVPVGVVGHHNVGATLDQVEHLLSEVRGRQDDT